MLTLFDFIGVAWRRVVGRMRRGAHTRDLQQELSFHLELLERDHQARGLTAEDARDAARVQLGNRMSVTETAWDQLNIAGFDLVVLDTRVAIRRLRKSPAFAVTTILVLALGIGMTSIAASIIDHILLRPLDYPSADRLVVLYQRGESGNQRLVSFPTFQDWAAGATDFAGLSYVRGDMVTLTSASSDKRFPAAFVSAGFFKVMSARPLIGRTFVVEEEGPGGPPAVILSEELWRREFSARATVIGKVVTLNGGPVVVVGVMPATFRFPEWAQIWRPLGQVIDRDPAVRQRDFHADSRAIGRLAPGVDSAHAVRQLAAVQHVIAETYPELEGKWTDIDLVPLRTEVVGYLSKTLWTLAVAVCLIVLIACVNVANLAAVRGATRGREIAVRVALGATRVAIMRQLLIESLLLATLGGILGVMGCSGVLVWLRATRPFDLPRAGEITLDWRVLSLALLLVVLTAVLFGVLPAMRAAVPRGSPNELIGSRSGSNGSLRETRGHAWRTGSQFAIALALLLAAGLLVQNYRRLQDRKLGFDPNGLLSITISPPKELASSPTTTLALYERLVSILRESPGIENAAFVNFLPLGRAGVPTQVQVPGRQSSSDDLATYITVSDGYLNTMRIPLLKGRWFLPQETHTAGDGVVISESVANRYWPRRNPIGQTLTIFRSSQDRAEFGHAVSAAVIGVVADVRQFGIESELDPAIYVPIAAEPWPWGSLVVRERRPGSISGSALGRMLKAAEPRIKTGPGPHENDLSLERVTKGLSDSLAPRRYVLALIGTFSSCALLLAAIGIYGVTNFAVTRRAKELGVRVALGATADTIMWSVLKRSMLPAIIGCVVGLACTIALGRALRHAFEDAPVTDPAVILCVSLLLLAVGIFACYLPARRAAFADPMIAIRED